METFITSLPYIQVVLAILMTASILVQKSESSIDGTFGGNDNWSAAYHSRRGFEKIIFNTTIILGILFIIASITNLFLK
jgi:protein translocase SecG subunit